MSRISEALGRDVEKQSKKHKEKESGKKSVHHFEVHPAEGGHIVETHYESKNGDEFGPRKVEKSVHKTMSSVAKHMKEACGEGDGEDENTES